MSAAKKRAGFSGDHPLLGVVVVVFLLCAVGASFALSAFGLWEQAGAMGVEGGSRILLVLTIDALIVGSTAAILIRRGRKEGTWFLWIVVIVFTAISMWANFTAHWEQGQGLTPSLIGALMPLTLLAATEVTLLTLVRSEGEAPAPKPKRTAAPVAVTPADAPVAAAPARTSIAATPRASRSTVGTVRATDYPFDDVLAMGEHELLAEFDRLAAHPDTNQKGSAESPRFSAVAWNLVEAHGHRLSDLARRAGHADAARIKDRVRRVREHAPVAA